VNPSRKLPRFESWICHQQRQGALNSANAEQGSYLHGAMAAAKRLGHSNASVTTRHYARAVEALDAEIADGFEKHAPEPKDDGLDED
jgi:hypothetical protein